MSVYDASLLGATEQEHCERLFKFGRLDGWLRHKTVVDVGCGVGGTLAFMRRAYPENEFVGVSNSDVQLAALREKRLIPMRVDMDSGALPRADLFVFQQSIGHAASMPDAIAECASKLSAGGRILIKDFDCDTAFVDETWDYRFSPAHEFIAAADCAGLTLMDIAFPAVSHARYLDYWRKSKYMLSRHGDPYVVAARTALMLFVEAPASALS